jgi:ATP-dependent Clp protease, protease subunit
LKPKEIQEALLNKNILYLGGDVDGGMVEYTGMSIATLIGRGSPPMTVYITSGGGRVSAGLDIYDLLSFYPNVKEGIVIAYAKSMAAVILQACTRRRALRHSRILIHHISTQDVTLDIMRSTKKKNDILRDMEKDQARLYKILSDRSGKSVKDISKKCKRDEDMSAQEAIEFGLLDGIVDPWKLETIPPQLRTP